MPQSLRTVGQRPGNPTPAVAGRRRGAFWGIYRNLNPRVVAKAAAATMVFAAEGELVQGTWVHLLDLTQGVLESPFLGQS